MTNQYSRDQVSSNSDADSTETSSTVLSLKRSKLVAKPVDHHQKVSSPLYKLVKSSSIQSAPSSNVQVKASFLAALRWWYVEIAACTLAVAALLAIIITLRTYQDKPAPKWPYHLSLNALLSIYVVLLKAGILTVMAQGLGQLKWTWYQQHRPVRDLAKYDDASRGAFGSLKLIWSLRFRNMLASAAAAITVLISIMDPFTQQLIYHQGCSLPVPWYRASIPRSNYFYWSSDPTSHSDTGLSNDFLFSIKKGSVSGVGEVKIDCGTGNCTFSRAYGTVGYCSICSDITDDVIISNNDTMRLILPSGLFLTNSSNISAIVSPYMNKAGNFEVIMNNHLTNAVRTTCQTRAGTNDNNGNSYSTTCQEYWASACRFYPCAKKYRAAIKLGALDEHEISRSGEEDLKFDENIGGSDALAIVDVDCLSNQEYQVMINMSQTKNPTVNWSPYDVQQLPFLRNRTTTDLHRCAYAWNNLSAIEPTKNYLKSFLNGTVLRLFDETRNITSFAGPESLQALTSSGNLNSESIQGLFNNISDAMTIYVRQHGHRRFSEPAVGIAQQSQTCLTVRWAWVVFPAILVVTSVIFFMSMVNATQPVDRETRIWKSSLLAVLFHGLDLEPRHDHDYDINNIDDMEAIAKEKIVTLGLRKRGVIKLVDSIDET